MKREKTVIYLSTCAVDRQGIPDPFMMQELNWLLTHFDRVLMVCHYGWTEFTGTEPWEQARIQVGGGKSAWWRAFLSAPFGRELWNELEHLRRDGKLSPVRGLKLLAFAIRGRRMRLWLEEALRTCDVPNTTLYAFWMSFEAYAAALGKEKHPALRLKIRGHAFDIDVLRNDMNPYLMKHFIARQAEEIFLISQHAKAQYLQYMKGQVSGEKLRVVGMGSKGAPLAEPKEPPFFQDGMLRVVSCATICEIKQLPLMIDALAQWSGARLHWLHLGGGPDEEAVRAYALKRLAEQERVTWEFTGRVDNGQVQRIYQEQAFDVFVNTSRMEGAPVSIMEAMRFGIPVIAPQVGGIPEMVDESVGLLYAPADGAQGMREALEAFAALPYERVKALRDEAKARWEKDFSSAALLPLVFPEEAGQGGGMDG